MKTAFLVAIVTLMSAGAILADMGTNLSVMISETSPITGKCARIDGQEMFVLTEDTPAQVLFKSKGWVEGYLQKGDAVFVDAQDNILRAGRCGNPARGTITRPTPLVKEVTRTITKTVEVPGPERIVEKQVPGPERIVKVPGPERVVEKTVTRLVERKVEIPVFTALMVQAQPLWAVTGPQQSYNISYFQQGPLNVCLIDEGDSSVSALGGAGYGAAAAAAAAASTSTSTAVTPTSGAAAHQGASGTSGAASDGPSAYKR